MTTLGDITRLHAELAKRLGMSDMASMEMLLTEVSMLRSSINPSIPQCALCGVNCEQCEMTAQKARNRAEHNRKKASK